MTTPDIIIEIYESPIVVEVNDDDTEIIISSEGLQGPPGPQGPQGLPGLTGGHFEEAFTNTSVVVVNHNLGYEPLTSVIVGGEEVDPDVVHSSINQFTITFAVPHSGKVVYV